MQTEADLIAVVKDLFKQLRDENVIYQRSDYTTTASKWIKHGKELLRWLMPQKIV